MIATPLVPFRRSLAARFHSIESSLSRRPLGRWMCISAAVTTAVYGCLTFGVVAQSMLVGAAAFRRLMDK